MKPELHLHIWNTAKKLLLTLIQKEFARYNPSDIVIDIDNGETVGEDGIYLSYMRVGGPYVEEKDRITINLHVNSRGETLMSINLLDSEHQLSLSEEDMKGWSKSYPLVDWMEFMARCGREIDDKIAYYEQEIANSLNTKSKKILEDFENQKPISHLYPKLTRDSGWTHVHIALKTGAGHSHEDSKTAALLCCLELKEQINANVEELNKLIAELSV